MERLNEGSLVAACEIGRLELIGSPSPIIMRRDEPHAALQPYRPFLSLVQVNPRRFSSAIDSCGLSLDADANMPCFTC